MSFFDTATTVEVQGYELDRARAVLTEIQHYFEFIIEPGSFAAANLAHQSTHIALLLDVTDEILSNIQPRLSGVADELYNLSKAQ